MKAGALSTLFESAPGSELMREHLIEACGADFDALMRSGLLREHTPAAEMICTDCGEAHFVGVEWSEVRGARGRFCPDGGGWAEMQPEALQRFRYDHDAFLAAIASELGLKGAPEMLVDGVCWRLGFRLIADTQVAIVVAREMNDPRRVMEIAGAVRARLKNWRGLILCGARPMVDVGLFPKGFKTAVFDDLVALNGESEIAVDADALALALGLTRRGRGEHGAPSDHPGLRPYLEGRLKSGASLENNSAEARHLLANLTEWATPNTATPEFDALRIVISRRRKKLG
mgnify:CR=1 FL=1